MELKKLKHRKGMFFSTDALIAIFIIFLVILIAYPLRESVNKKSDIHYDLIKTLSEIKVKDSANPYLKNLMAQGKIRDENLSLLEQVGEFYVTNVTLARDLMNSLLSEIKTERNIGIWYGDTLIASQNKSPYDFAKEVDVARQIISGISEGGNVTGFSARAFLTNSLQQKYFYFGGYVGEGNISQNISYFGNISYAVLEIAANQNFDFYVNGNKVGRFNASPNDFVPVSYNISKDYFRSGENLIEFRGENFHLSGGFIKIIYASDVDYERPKIKYLPGIHGLVNLYDGFYIPGNLSEMRIFLHLNSTNASIFFTIGNTTIYKNVTRDEESINFSNSYLSSLLNYLDLNKKTIPLRIGLENVSFNVIGKANVISVADISGSMAPSCSITSSWCCFLQGGCNTLQKCSNCGGLWENKINASKEANKIFIDSVLNYSGNKVGLVVYNTSYVPSFSYPLSNNSLALKAKVNSWIAAGSTCICCGIINATRILAANMSNNTFSSMVVMSDGQANIRCYSGPGNAVQDAINASCFANSVYNITIYSIGFGSDADEATLQAIANCGKGEYYYGGVEEISQIYQNVAQSIISRYQEQTIQTNSNYLSQLYPDSYIFFNYTQEALPRGLILTSEKFFNNKVSGEFLVPQNSSVIEASVTSYSGARWTDLVKVNNYVSYNLSSYGGDYILLGDPYLINLPNERIFSGKINNVSLTTASGASNSTDGSEYNKIIYTVGKEFSSFSDIVSLANGCIWHIEFEDGNEVTINVPSNYSGSDICYYSSSYPSGRIANENDALQLAVMNLVRELDFDYDGKVDVLFRGQQLSISTDEIIGIPFLWATEVQIRVWD